MKTLIISALFFAVACSSAHSERELLSSPLFDGIKPEMKNFIKISEPNRTVGSPGHEAAFNYLKGEFQKIAAKAHGKVYVQEFSPDVEYAAKNYQKDFDTLVKPKFSKNDPVYKKWKDFTERAIAFSRSFKNTPGHNLILEIPGQANHDDVIYLGAHYDTITHNHETLTFTPNNPAPGADDNASSLMALLATAREFAQRPHDRTVRFVAFDYEEIFFLGSYALAKELSSHGLKWLFPNEHNLGLINLEMIGWSKTPMLNHPVVKVYTEVAQAPNYQEDLNLAQYFARGVELAKSPLKTEVLANNFNRSDNWSFWQWSYPSICVSEDWEKDFNEANYHTSNDTPDTLNFDYLKEITLSTMEALNALAQNPIRPILGD